MVFNSRTFLVFYAAVLALYWVLPMRYQNRLLLLASYYFYASWDIHFLPLLILTSAVGYGLGIAIGNAKTLSSRKAWLASGVVFNIGILSYFKYSAFLADGFAEISRSLGLPMEAPLWNVVLPIGISFYLFHILSYLIDIYRGKSVPNRDFVSVSLFVAFFPLLVAGPIERAGHLLPEIDRPRKVDLQVLVRAADLILWGFFKKVFIADNLAGFVSPVFAHPAGYSGLSILLATYAFAIQIYCDFSGYSDIARGVSKSMGFELNLNFNLPYFAKYPSDFWKRWHISLSSWLRDYLYIGMGGNRGGTVKTYRNLMATMLLGGLWHGANWTFLLWGCFHGAILILQRLLEPLAAFIPGQGVKAKAAAGAQILLMFHVTCFGWLIFRSDTIGGFLAMAANLAGGFAWDGDAAILARALVKYGWFLFAVQIIQHARRDLKFFPLGWIEARWAFYMFLLCSIFFMGDFGNAEFIYFQF